MGKDKTYTNDGATNVPDSNLKKTTKYSPKETQKYAGSQEIYERPTSEDKTLRIPYDVMKSSKNAKVQEIVEKLEDALTLDRITAYNEVHNEWEDSGVWG